MRPANSFAASSSGGMFGGGGRRGDSQDVVQNEQAALHGRGSIRVRGHGQHGSLRQNAAAWALRWQSNEAHLITLDAIDPIVFRQPLVQERVIADQQLPQTAVSGAQCGRRASRSRASWPGAARRSARVRGSRRNDLKNAARTSFSSFFSLSVSASGDRRFSSWYRARYRSASGSDG